MLKNIVLIGFMGTGKSCIGRLLANRLGYHFIDTDTLVEKNAKMSIPTIFKTKGEAYFRQLERDAVHFAAHKHCFVISTGGGVPLDAANREVLQKHGIIISLFACADTILTRTMNRNNRPLLKNDLQSLLAMMEKRRPFYKKADFIIDTDDLSPLQIVNEILFYLRKNHSTEIRPRTAFRPKRNLKPDKFTKKEGVGTFHRM